MLLNKTYVMPVLTLIVGLIVGFFPIYFSQSGELDTLRSAEIDLSENNRVMQAELAELQSAQGQADLLEAELSRLLLTSASGGGVNMKMMPHPETNELSVELPEVFSFDANHAFCRVDTNPEAFIMPTYQMGDVLIDKHEFFMAMSTTSMEEFKLSRTSDGRKKVVITGGLDCFTEVAKAQMAMGSREVAEIAEYKIEAIDGGLGGGQAGDTFEFTVYFDPAQAPLNYAIFGPEFTFTGDMVDGEVTIPDPR